MYRKIFIFIAFAFVILAFNSGLSLAASSEEGTEPEAAAQSSPEETQKLVTAIEVKGNKSISSNTIISKMKTRQGTPYLEKVISDDLKRLYLLGYFSDIKIDTEDYKKGVKVIISVVERPMIERINFTGINRLTTKDEKIKEKLKSKEKQYLDYPSLAEDVETIKKMYEKLGYTQVQVDYIVNENKETNKVGVEFRITENKKSRIKDILFDGNDSFKKARLLRVIKTRRAWLFNAGVLKDEVLKEDVERLKSFYQREGFADVTVDYGVNSDPKRPYLLYINFKIKEGKKYIVGNVVVEGNKDITREDILAKLKDCVPGKVFSQEALKSDIASIQSLYFDRGYISAQAQEATSVNTFTGRVDVTYSITENQIFYVDKIKIRGNVKTRDIVIRRELRIHPGDRFDGEKLRRSRERLYNLGFFDEQQGISFDTEDTPAPDKKNLIVDVKETKTGAFSFGGGYSTVDQLVGFIEIEQKNFDWKNFPYFTGAGQNLKLRASIGSITKGFDLSFTDPWVFDYPVTFGFDAYMREHLKDEDVGYGYDEKVTGGDLRLGKEVSEYLRGDLTYRLDKIEISNIDDAASSDLKKEAGNNVISSITPGFTFDSRDNVFDTKRGNLLTGSLEFAGGPLSGDKNFWKFFGRASHYFPLPKNSSLEVRGRIGISDPYGNSDTIPIYERFFAGGAYTIRGYKERAIGPVDPVSSDPLGGNALLVGNVEYSYPIFDFLKLAVFVDSGNVWENSSDIGTGEFKTGIGLGVRIRTPIGPIMLDYGIPSNKTPGEEERGNGRLHFSASHGF